MGGSFGNLSRDDDVNNTSFVSGNVSVTNSQIEAKASDSRLAARQMVAIYNGSSTTIYYGPTGVTTTTGNPIFKYQELFLPVGDAIAVYLIAATVGPHTVRIKELS